MNMLDCSTVKGIQLSMVKLSHLAALSFRGIDAGSFLHNQLSADVNGLANGDATFACYCEPKGRVLALLLVQRVDAGYHAILSATLAQAVADRLKIYRLRAKVDIEIMRDQTVLGFAADEEAPAPAIPLPGGQRKLALCASDQAAGADETLLEAWRFTDLQSGISWLDEKTSGEFLPQMLGFEELGAVNYRKGCYPGQEIVARTHYLGKVKRHPRLLDCRLSARPQPMDKLNIYADGEAHEAVVVESAHYVDGLIRLLTVTRMEPELPAATVEFDGEKIEVQPPS